MEPFDYVVIAMLFLAALAGAGHGDDYDPDAMD